MLPVPAVAHEDCWTGSQSWYMLCVLYRAKAIFIDFSMHRHTHTPVHLTHIHTRTHTHTHTCPSGTQKLHAQTPLHSPMSIRLPEVGSPNLCAVPLHSPTGKLLLEVGRLQLFVMPLHSTTGKLLLEVGILKVFAVPLHSPTGKLLLEVGILKLFAVALHSPTGKLLLEVGTLKVFAVPEGCMRVSIANRHCRSCSRAFLASSSWASSSAAPACIDTQRRSGKGSGLMR